MIVKVCGMREPENIRAIEQAGADWMGFIFFPHSARYVTHCPEYLPEQCPAESGSLSTRAPRISC